MDGKTVLFTDLRHIQCGYLVWHSPVDDKPLFVVGPPEPSVDAYSVPQFVPFGIKLIAQKARKTGPLPKGIKVAVNKIVREDGVYKSWYLDVEYPPGKDLGSYSKEKAVAVYVCCSESKDGYEWNEKARSPIPIRNRSGFDGFTVFQDKSAPTQERYKAVYSVLVSDEEREAVVEKFRKIHPAYRDERIERNINAKGRFFSMFGAVSPDGLVWTEIPETIMIHMGDTLTNVYYDERLGKYVMFTRLFIQDRRWVGRAETDDFRNWDNVVPLIWCPLDDPYCYDIYTNGWTKYPYAENYQFMFPMFYNRMDESSIVRMYSSADGICWNRVPGGPVIEHGSSEEWDGSFIFAGSGMVPLSGDNVGILYGGTRYPHKYPRWKDALDAVRTGWAMWEKDRLCAVTAKEFGEFFTLPFIPACRQINLNCRVQRGGEIKVGIYGANGRSAEDCDPIFSDGISVPVHWKGNPDIGVKDNEKVIFQFKMRSAEIFGFKWEY